MSKKNISFDTADTKDYSAITIIDIKKNTIESRILRTDNPNPNSWLRGFMEETKK